MHSTESLDIWCDAPPYSVVEACWLIGVRSPEDVRWCHIDRFRRGSGRRALLLNALSWLWRLTGKVGPNRCSCGAHLPALQPFQFLFDEEDRPTYWIGQCGRCSTVFWKEAQEETQEAGPTAQEV